MTKWTSEQQLAIDKEGTNIIVSAGAGSGKTAVLTERVIRKLRDGVDINHLLVLTFTNAAAAEMKDRIRAAIKKENMLDQLDYIDSAYITTFDSFAGSVVKKYHYLLNISSSIKVVDSSVLNIEKNKIIDSIFEEFYSNKKFQNLISNFCDRDDSSIKKALLLMNDKLDLKSDKEKYLENYINDFYHEKNITSLIKDYEKIIINKKNNLNLILENIQIYADGNFYNALNDLLINLLNSNSYEEIRKNLLIEKFPTLRGAEEDLKNYYTDLKDEISLLQDLCYYSNNDLLNNLLSTKDNVEIIVDILIELDRRLSKYKYENEAYEFNDIAKMAIQIVRDNKEVQNELKNYFNEIMVDEYQDTSDLQETFISLISNNNVYMVGDIKQSIYRFRHANPEIFRTKYNNYSKGISGYKIDLLKNFRSRDEVLNNINEIFDSVMDEKIGNAEYQESHRMVFGNNVYVENKFNQNYDLDILNYKKEAYEKYSNDEIEAFIIANDIKNKIENHYQILDKKTNTLRNFNYGDACIIMDRGSAFETYKKIFEYLSIPLVVWKDEILNGSDDILILKNIISLIIKIKKQEYDQEFKYYFTSIARSYLFKLDDQKIFNYFLNNNFKESEIFIKTKNISEQLDNIDNNELLNLIINEFNIYEKNILVGNMEKSIVRLENFSSLFSSLSELGYTPYDLLEYFKESNDCEMKYSLNAKIPNNVNLMNIHKSKGLEFSVCYFSGFAKKFNKSDVKEKFIFDDKLGIIIPFSKDGYDDTILKTLFKDKYNLEDVSERIRLFYVGVTRAKEKMIIVTSLDDKEHYLNNIVDDNIRINYTSFLDILNSIKNKIEKYVINIDLNNIKITKDYDLIKTYNYKDNIDLDNTKIENIKININNEIVTDEHFSKLTHKLHTKEEIENMELGTYIHYLFEITDFKNPDLNIPYSNYINNFIKQIDTNCNIYKEYEFIYEENNIVKHGIIDLMLEYEDNIKIIDYKLKHIIDDNYKLQIKGYKNYIENKTHKKVNTYLYSIFDDKLEEIK